MLLLEKTSPECRGGNTKYTRNIRLAGSDYPDEAFLADLTGVTGEDIDRDLAAITIERSREVAAWMEANGAGGRLRFAALSSSRGPIAGPLLVVHLGVVGGLFATTPYGKFVHAVHRLAALLRYEAETRA